MGEIAIRARQVSKVYRIGQRETYPTLREAIMHAVQTPRRRIQSALAKEPGAERQNREDNTILALEDVSFEVNRGEVLGVIGGNGAGKSTLLKILSRITRPTRGCAEIYGRVGSLLEVGTGFHPELTGRENIYLNGAILGMRKAEIDRKFAEIVEFAEVEKFIDTPVKRYSSGMYMRLAFSVAAHLEPEILLVDEVLAVGDLQFQKKCLGKMGKVAKEGRTVIFVSHNMAAISVLCSAALLLEQGRVIFQGDADRCIERYISRYALNQGSTWLRPASSPARSLMITKIDASLSGEQPDLFLNLEINLASRGRHKPAFLAVDILDTTGVALMQALPDEKGYLDGSSSEHCVVITVQLPPLIPGQYLVSIWAGSHNTGTLDEVKEAVAFDVYTSPTNGRTYPHTKDHGFIVPASTVRLAERPHPGGPETLLRR